MTKITILGWKSGVEVDPLVLLRILRASLDLGLEEGKGMLDKFSQDGRLALALQSEAADRLKTMAGDAGIRIEQE
jgi:hypothetical protein